MVHVFSDVCRQGYDQGHDRNQNQPARFPRPTEEQDQRTYPWRRSSSPNSTDRRSLLRCRCRKHGKLSSRTCSRQTGLSSPSTICHRLLEQLERTAQDPEGPSVTLHDFHIHPVSRLMYFLDKGKTRLVIPAKMVRRMLRLAHDDRAHVGITRAHHFLRDIAFSPQMRQEIEDHMHACATRGLAQVPDTSPSVISRQTWISPEPSNQAHIQQDRILSHFSKNQLLAVQAGAATMGSMVTRNSQLNTSRRPHLIVSPRPSWHQGR